MRVVLDPNIFISAVALPGGRADAALDAAIEGCAALVVTGDRKLLDLAVFDDVGNEVPRRPARSTGKP